MKLIRAICFLAAVFAFASRTHGVFAQSPTSPGRYSELTLRMASNKDEVGDLNGRRSGSIGGTHESQEFAAQSIGHNTKVLARLPRVAAWRATGADRPEPRARHRHLSHRFPSP